MARLDTVVLIAVQAFPAYLATRRIVLMTRNIRHDKPFAHALFGNEHDAWRAWLGIRMAQVVGKRGMPARSRTVAIVSTLGNRGSTWNWWVFHRSTACAG